MKYIIIVPVVIAITAANVLLDGVTLLLLWGWFATPYFAPLTLAKAIGMCLIVNLLTYQYIPRTKDEQHTAAFYTFAMPLFLLAIGYIVKLIM